VAADGLRALRERVHADPELARALAGLDDDALHAHALSLAADISAEVTPEDLAGAIEAARREWLLRWIR
jgi:hypothetical protein